MLSSLLFDDLPCPIALSEEGPSLGFAIEMSHGARWSIDGFASPQQVEFPVESSAHLIARIFDLIVRHVDTSTFSIYSGPT
jgi:hypothetical protein